MTAAAIAPLVATGGMPILASTLTQPVAELRAKSNGSFALWLLIVNVRNDIVLLLRCLQS